MKLYGKLSGQRGTKPATKGDMTRLHTELSKKGVTEFTIEYTEQGIEVYDLTGILVYKAEMQKAQAVRP